MPIEGLSSNAQFRAQCRDIRLYVIEAKKVGVIGRQHVRNLRSGGAVEQALRGRRWHACDPFALSTSPVGSG
jgi:hypothetical protein